MDYVHWYAFSPWFFFKFTFSADISVIVMTAEPCAVVVVAIASPVDHFAIVVHPQSLRGWKNPDYLFLNFTSEFTPFVPSS